jgi:hypothetical protein
LGKNETPPPWNALAFLEPRGCEHHAYVKEATERRQESPFLVAPNVSNTNDHGARLHGVHWPNFSSNSAKYLRLAKNRPVILKLWGEVFWREIYAKQSCSDADIVVNREVETHGKDCLTMHFLQGVSTALSAKGLLEQVQSVSDVKSDKFCSMIIKFNSSRPTEMFKTTLYDIDALVRHMFFLQLSEYKPCERIVDCPGNPYTSFECMKGYKFHITMVSENMINDNLHCFEARPTTYKFVSFFRKTH